MASSQIFNEIWLSAGISIMWNYHIAPTNDIPRPPLHIPLSSFDSSLIHWKLSLHKEKGDLGFYSLKGGNVYGWPKIKDPNEIWSLLRFSMKYGFLLALTLCEITTSPTNNIPRPPKHSTLVIQPFTYSFQINLSKLNKLFIKFHLCVLSLPKTKQGKAKRKHHKPHDFVENPYIRAKIL